MSEEVDIEKRSFDLGVLSERVSTATSAIETDRLAQEERIKAANRKQRAWRVAGAIGAVSGPIALITAVALVVVVRQNNAERADRTQTSCVQSAEAAMRDNSQDATTVRRLGAVVAGSDNPDTVAFLEDWIVEIESNRSPVRDCSAAGIEAYFGSGGTEGYLP